MRILSNPSKYNWAQKVCDIWPPLGGGILKELLYFGLRTLNTIIPKKNNQILFASIPDYSDNAKALYEYIITNQTHQQYDIIWLVNDSKVLQMLTQNGVKAYFEKSIHGLYSIFRSGYIIGTHNHYSRLKVKNQYLANLWHGMPLKAMGYADGSETEDTLRNIRKGGKADNILIATSSTTRNALATGFYIDPRKIVITGQPRNDYLFMDHQEQKLSKLLDLDISQYNKLLLYMPTFRVGRGRIEGATNHLDFLRSEYFNEFLRNNQILFVLKLHPFEENYWLSQDNFKEPNGNIVILKTGHLTGQLISIYEVIKDFDILITDYSSIYFDFLLLNKPIIFLPLDLEQYTQTRGFSLEPYDFWTPGPKVTTVGMLIDEIQKCISDPTYYEKERKTINNLINQFQDGSSCERVWEQIQCRVGTISCKQR
jgi:CDP-glycerol glycerophosphotransferase